MKGATSLVRCLEAEGVRHVFGIPGEENLGLMDSLIDSDMDFVLTRHEASAAFMAGMVGRLTGRPGACLTTLGPGASNMVIGVAEAYLGYSPMIAMSGQVSSGCRMPRKQYIDLMSMFRPITKDSISVRSADDIPALTHRAFGLAVEERPGPVFMELPEDVMRQCTDAMPLLPRERRSGAIPDLEALRTMIASSERPLVLSGAGVLRANASDALRSFVSAWNIPTAMTWLGAGSVAYDDELSLNTIGLRDNDIVHEAFELADLIILVGFDLIEFEPRFWQAGGTPVAYVGSSPCDDGQSFQPSLQAIGDLPGILSALAREPDAGNNWASGIRARLHRELDTLPQEGKRVRPQHIIQAIRDSLGRSDVAVSDVGSHLIWMAKRYPVYEPHTMLVSNGLIPMGVGIPWAISSKLTYPDRKVVASVGDGSFAMTGMELETAKRLGISFVTVIWSDERLSLIQERQRRAFGRSTGADFGHQDFVRYAQSLGIDGYYASTTEELGETLSQCLRDDVLAVIEVDVDAGENDKLRVG